MNDNQSIVPKKKSNFTKILEETIPDRVLVPKVYGRRRFKILYKEVAESVFLGQKKVKGVTPYGFGLCLNIDFQTDGDRDSDIAIVEMTNIKGEFQLLCECCGIIDINYPCEHKINDPSVVIHHKCIVSSQRLEFGMKMINVRV